MQNNGTHLTKYSFVFKNIVIFYRHMLFMLKGS